MFCSLGIIYNCKSTKILENPDIILRVVYYYSKLRERFLTKIILFINSPGYSYNFDL